MQAVLFLFLRIALQVILISFLGIIGWYLWREWRSRKETLRIENQPLLILIQQADGLNLRFRSSEVILGRGLGCDAVIPDPTLSSRHARFSYHHQQWWIEDLHTTNGTFLNGQMITTPVVVTNSDTIMCGRVRLDVVIEEKG